MNINPSIKTKISFKDLFLISIFLLPLIKFVIEYNFFNLRFIDDTQGSYSYFQYIYNYFGEHFNIPIWIDYLDGGLPSSLIIQHELSIFSVFFIIIGNIFKLNPYWAFILLILFFNILFLYGLYLNLKNFNKKNDVFIVLSFIHLLSFDLLFHFHSLISITFVPFSFYYITKYFRSYKFAKLRQIFLVNLIFFFSHIHYYNIITLIYLPIFIFLVFYCLSFKETNTHFIKKKISGLKFRHLLWFFLLFSLSVIFYLALKFQMGEYTSSSYGRDSYQLEYKTFIDFYEVPIRKILSWFFLETFVLLSINPGPVGISLIFFAFLYFYKLKINNIYIVSITIFVFSFYLSNTHDFYLLKEVFGRVIFAFPFMDYVRGLNNIILLNKFFVLLTISFSIKLILEDKLSFNKNLLLIIIINLVYTEIFFSINHNSMDPRIWIPYFFGLNFFLFFLLFKVKKNTLSFIFVIFISTLPYYLKSFTFDEYYNGKDFKTLDYINKNKNLNLTNICLRKSDIKILYKNYFNQKIVPLSKHNQFFLNTEFRPCNVIKNQRLRGSNKNYDIDNNTARASFFDKNLDFNYKVEIDKKAFYVRNYFLNDNVDIESDVDIIASGLYNIKTNAKDIKTNLSYTKHWKIVSENKNYILTNEKGFLKIKTNNKELKNIRLYYDNSKIRNIIYLFIFLSFLIYISLTLIIIKKLKT